MNDSAAGLPRRARPDYTEKTETTTAEIWVDSPNDTAVRVVIQTTTAGGQQVAVINLTASAAREMANVLRASAAEVERIERARPLNGQLSIF